jgi:hypothetical protein
MNKSIESHIRKEVTCMGFGLNDITSIFGKDNCKDGKGNNSIFILIIIIIIICGCSSNGFSGLVGCVPCAPGRYGSRGRGSGNSWIIILAILLCLGGNNGLLGDSAGNVNTNIINVEREDFVDDY